MHARRAWFAIRILHVEGQVVRLRGRESSRIVDPKEFIEEAGAFAALDVAPAAAGVGVCVERHDDSRIGNE